MFHKESLWMWLGIGLVLLAVGCTQVSGAPTPEASSPSPSTVPAVQNTTIAEAPVKVKLIISQPLTDNNSGVAGLAFSPDGKTLASLYENGEIILWDLATRQSLRSFMGGGQTDGFGIMPGFTFSPDGRWLVSRANGVAPMLWDVVTGQSTEVESGLSRSDGMALSLDGRLLAYGRCEELNAQSHCSRYEIVLWDVTARQPVGRSLRFSVGAPAPLGLLFSPDGKTLAALSSGTTGSGNVELFDVITGQSMTSPLKGEARFSGMAFSPDGNFMALGSTVDVIYFWNVKSQQVSSQLTGERGPVTGLTFSPDGKMLASRILVPSTDSIPHEKIVLWNRDSLQTIGQPLTGQTATGRAVGLISTAFSPDGMTLASGTAEGAIILWDLAVSSHSQ